MYTLCDHSTVTTYRIKGTEYEFDVCTTCGLDPALPPITASHDDELLPWWDWKPTQKRIIDSARPGINALHERRDAAREQVMLLRELVAYEAELGESPSPELAEELAEAEAHRLSLLVFAHH